MYPHHREILWITLAIRSVMFHRRILESWGENSNMGLTDPMDHWNRKNIVSRGVILKKNHPSGFPVVMETWKNMECQGINNFVWKVIESGKNCWQIMEIHDHSGICEGKLLSEVGYVWLKLRFYYLCTIGCTKSVKMSWNFVWFLSGMSWIVMEFENWFCVRTLMEIHDHSGIYEG